MIRLLLFSRDENLTPLLAPALGSGFHVTTESECDAATQFIDAGNCDVVLLDLDACTAEDQINKQPVFSDITGLNAAVIVLTDDDARSIAVEMVQQGAHSYCRKPPALRELKPMIRRAYEHITMRRELDSRSNAAPEPACDQLIGLSEQMKTVYALIGKVANLNASILITGESGTGKELIANAIHNLGNRSKQPFVAVSCGAIPETLIESELFGHEKGAFTGTTGTRIGYFEQAGGGTLFLDEIGELSSQTQVKLLRVLQQREFTRLGSNRAIPLRARIIFATHRDLKAMVAENKFRLDLYYRVNVMTLDVPALVERPEDIPALANHFLAKYSEAYSKPVSSISMAAMKMLEHYDWPGNVRELENVIQGAIIRADGNCIQPTDLPESMRTADVGPAEDCVNVGTFERLLREYKVKLALKAIEDCQGNKTLAARSLDISRAYLHRLIRADAPTAIDAA